MNDLLYRNFLYKKLDYLYMVEGKIKKKSKTELNKYELGVVRRDIKFIKRLLKGVSF